MLRAFDVFFIIAAARFSYSLYFDSWAVPDHYRLAYSAAALLVLTLFPFVHLYRIERGSGLLDELGRMLLATGLLFMLLALTAVLSKTSESYSRVWFVLWFLLSMGTFASYRVIARLVMYILRHKGVDQKRLLLAGTWQQTQRVVETIANQPWMGFQVQKIYSTDRVATQEQQSLPMTTHPISELTANLDAVTADEIWICLPVSEANDLHKLINQFVKLPIPLRYVPDFFGFDLINHSVNQMGDLPIVNLSVSPMYGWNRVIKWLEDRLLSSLILLIISPLLVLIACGVKLSSRGPIFYRQERVSWNGKRFQMLKFRSMPVDNEHQEVRWGGAQNKEATRFGRFLRATSLDELPQFINVLKGDMSIVGPRPERTIFVEQFKNEIPRYMQKHVVKAGITGWAQIHGWRGDTDLKKRIEHDMYYIENWSLWLDLKIILLTLVKGFLSPNAY